jgi:predicted dehydrogenase
MAEDDDYGLSPDKKRKTIPAPPVDYLPPKPKSFYPKIGLIGAGGISEFHLKNYRTCGFEVAAISSRTKAKAVEKRDQFYPNAEVHENYRDLLNREDIEVVDITPHPVDRLPILREALEAGKHVLSQKPFVHDLTEGRKLADLAASLNLKIAVNQNGRWAPHFSYLRSAIANDLIGQVVSVDFSLQWDQTWIKGIEAFESIHHMVLFDFAVHWFDITSCFMAGQEPKSVFASAVRNGEQIYQPPSLAAVVIDYSDAQVRMAFNAHTTLGEEDVTTIVGTKGTLRARGPGLNNQSQVEVHLEEGSVRVPLEGCWFESGFQGTMGELLCAIEEDREPAHGARNNLRSLELCFAALESANTGKAIKPGQVTRLPETPKK